METEETFPEDDTPEGIHFETFDENCQSNLTFSVDVFLCWLNEGRYSCDVAQTLLHLWAHSLASSKHETLYDFYHQLLEEYKVENDDKSATCISVLWLAKKIRLLGTLSFAVTGTTSEEIEQEISKNICEEVASVQAYCRTWQANASYLKEKQQTVE